ncbi:hypothetical protein FNV43_RR27300 [Rhamnella rubrinervis]|uniref:Uncharacterized protein n=1 Tax=Rhamnella rubrinervis TaxID=2594499 RepID=A0A8K0DKB1_9ROSA|nr:hypothetical protein FNV43_RR27300 [Rhamnella rubrinervis]
MDLLLNTQSWLNIGLNFYSMRSKRQQFNVEQHEAIKIEVDKLLKAESITKLYYPTFLGNNNSIQEGVFDLRREVVNSTRGRVFNLRRKMSLLKSEGKFLLEEENSISTRGKISYLRRKIVVDSSYPEVDYSNLENNMIYIQFVDDEIRINSQLNAAGKNICAFSKKKLKSFFYSLIILGPAIIGKMAFGWDVKIAALRLFNTGAKQVVEVGLALALEFVRLMTKVEWDLADSILTKLEHDIVYSRLVNVKTDSPMAKVEIDSLLTEEKTKLNLIWLKSPPLNHNRDGKLLDQRIQKVLGY